MIPVRGVRSTCTGVFAEILGRPALAGRTCPIRQGPILPVLQALDQDSRWAYAPDSRKSQGDEKEFGLAGLLGNYPRPLRVLIAHNELFLPPPMGHARPRKALPRRRYFSVYRSEAPRARRVPDLIGLGCSNRTVQMDGVSSLELDVQRGVQDRLRWRRLGTPLAEEAAG